MAAGGAGRQPHAPRRSRRSGRVRPVIGRGALARASLGLAPQPPVPI